MSKIYFNKPKIVFIITSVYMLKFFLIPHIKILSKFFEITLLLKNDAPNILETINLPIEIIEIPIERKISIIKDIKALFLIYKICKKFKFDCVHTLTPKAGLLGMVAAFISGVPRRLHTFQGEVWSNKTGIIRYFFKTFDRLMVLCSTHLLVVSESEKQFLKKERVLLNKEATVLGSGSISGVDLNKFKTNQKFRRVLREKKRIKVDDLVFMYLGRICKDKGLIDFAKAFKNLSKTNNKIKLMFVGPQEDETTEKLQNLFKDNFKDIVFFEKYTSKPEKDLLIADILVLPSYREGFGVAIIEAASLGIPSIGSNIYGIQDAIIDNHTGLLFKVGNKFDLEIKMKKLILHNDIRLQMGFNAKQRVKEKFCQKVVLGEFLKYYRSLF